MIAHALLRCGPPQVEAAVEILKNVVAVDVSDDDDNDDPSLLPFESKLLVESKLLALRALSFAVIQSSEDYNEALLYMKQALKLAESTNRDMLFMNRGELFYNCLQFHTHQGQTERALAEIIAKTKEYNRLDGPNI